MTYFDEYLNQFRGSGSGQLNSTYTSMFFFYAFKYILVFPISVYNIVFIPLQFGFSIAFNHWYLFMEILTLIVYTIDIGFIIRQFLLLRKQKKLLNLPSESVEFENRFTAHDKDEIETKLR